MKVYFLLFVPLRIESIINVLDWQMLHVVTVFPNFCIYPSVIPA